MFSWGEELRVKQGWPARIGPLRVAAGAVTLRPVKILDAGDWSRLRIRNQNLLAPWEPSCKGNWVTNHKRSNWALTYYYLRSEVKRGVVLPFVIEVDGHYIGQLTIGNLQRGAVRSAWIGYWVDQEWTGMGIATAAVALSVDHAFGPVGLHRLEATVQSANGASRAVLSKLGFRHEGVLMRYMYINGRWRDHDLFALTAEEIMNSAVDILVQSGQAQLK